MLLLDTEPNHGSPFGIGERDQSPLGSGKEPMVLRNTVCAPLMMSSTSAIRLGYSSSILPDAESVDFAQIEKLHRALLQHNSQPCDRFFIRAWSTVATATQRSM